MQNILINSDKLIFRKNVICDSIKSKNENLHIGLTTVSVKCLNKYDTDKFNLFKLNDNNKFKMKVSMCLNKGIECNKNSHI